MSRRITTDPDSATPRAMTPQQELAVDLLASGKTVTEAAAAIGVSRQTVSEWLNRSADFRASLNVRRQELWEAMGDRLRALLPDAVEALASELRDGNRLKAVALVLRACGADGLTAPNGATDPEDIEIANRERDNDRVRRSTLASIGF
jgi:DNA-binding transcriptional ArsR family regulator